MNKELRRKRPYSFTPKLTHTSQGTAIIKRFNGDVCGITPDWNMPDYLSEEVERIRAQVGDEESHLGLVGRRCCTALLCYKIRP